MKKVKAKFKLWLSTRDAEGVFGDGKWRLLRAIQTTGSLTAASRSLGISYRKAWGDLNKAEKTLHLALIEKERGGSRGGYTALTPQGKKWLKAYGRFRTEIEKAVEQAYATHMKGLAR